MRIMMGVWRVFDNPALNMKESGSVAAGRENCCPLNRGAGGSKRRAGAGWLAGWQASETEAARGRARSNAGQQRSRRPGISLGTSAK